MKLKDFIIWPLVVFASAANATPSPYVLHERRNALTVLPRGQRVQNDAVVAFHIALKQSNLENAYDYLLNISHPSSPHYGKLWSQEEVRKTFEPAYESVEVVQAWLMDSGIEDVVESASKSWLSFEVTVSQAEGLFQSQYYEHTDPHSGAVRIACGEYVFTSQVVC